MAEVLYDPEQDKVEVLKTSSGALEYKEEDGKRHVRKCCKIVRDICAKRGINQEAVPCIHRPTKRFRYWDVRQGRIGGSHKCVLLLETQWRIATPEEVEAQHRKWEADRKAAQDAAKREAAKQLAIEAVAAGAINAMQNDPNYEALAEVVPQLPKEQKRKS